MALVVKNPPTSAGHVRHVNLVSGSGRAPGGGHGNPLQYSCLENPMDRGAWWAPVHRVTKRNFVMDMTDTNARHTHKRIKQVKLILILYFI